MNDQPSREMLREYVSQTMNEEQNQLRKDIACKIEVAAYECKTLLPEGRYKSLALTALEQAAMWATKAISHDTLIVE